MSDTIRKKIAAAAKVLVRQQGVEKVSVTSIMTKAQLRRQTFYDYFQDKYDLLAWLYEDEVSEVIEGNLSYEHWSKVLYHVCIYFAENRMFYQRVFANHDQNAPDIAIEAHTKTLIDAVFEDLVKTRTVHVDQGYRDYLIRFLTSGLVSEIRLWLMEAPEVSAEIEFKRTQRFIEDTFNGLLLRMERIHTYEHQEILD